MAANGPGPIPAISITFTSDSGPMRVTIASVSCMVETLASGYGLVEGPTVDDDGNLYFSDVLGGGVYRREPDGEVTTVVPKRRGVGGIALHADGGIVVSGRDIVHVRDGENRTLFSIDALPGWNDLCADSTGRIYAGSIRFAVFDPDSTPVPGELWRIDAEGDATALYGDVLHPNGVALSPGERTVYHSDTRNNVIVVHTLTDDGMARDRHALHFPPGAPDGMAIDAQGLLWVASARAGCVARMTPDGEIDRVLEVPAQTVTSLCFAGDEGDLYVVTADNTDAPERRGSIFRIDAGVGGAPVHPARI
jgi:gluconolactonase